MHDRTKIQKHVAAFLFQNAIIALQLAWFIWLIVECAFRNNYDVSENKCVTAVNQQSVETKEIT